MQISVDSDVLTWVFSDRRTLQPWSDLLVFIPDRFLADQDSPAAFTFPSQLLSQKLTTLSLVICTYGASFQPNSILLPILTSLSLKVVEPRRLIGAILAPKLVSFSFAKYEYDRPFNLSTVFSGLDSRFNGVRDLVLCKSFGSQQREDAEAICLVFPNLENAEMTVQHSREFFNVTGGLAPADHWHQVQCLVFDASGYLQSFGFINIKSWLKKREEHSKLRVVFTKFPLDYHQEFFEEFAQISSNISYLYDAPRKLCFLEFVNTLLAKGLEPTLRTNSFSQLVRLCTLPQFIIPYIEIHQYLQCSGRHYLPRFPSEDHLPGRTVQKVQGWKHCGPTS